MNSKILTNEKELDLSNGIKLYYGSMSDSTSNVICITVKGKFKPIVNLKDYKLNIKRVKDSFNTQGNTYLLKSDWFDKHYIFTNDFTECGITFKNTYKWKFKIYISPVVNKDVEEYRTHIIKLSEDMIDILQYNMNLNSFTTNI